MINKMLVIAGAMTLAAVSSAQLTDAPFGPAQGVKTISFAAAYSSTSGGGVTVKSTQIQLVGSYFFTNAIEGRLGYQYQNVDAGGSVSSDALLLGGRYYFTANRELSVDSPLAPFGGLFFTTSKVTGSDRASGFGLEVGAHYFLQPNVAVTPTLSWARQRVNSTDVDTTQLGVGLTVFFK